MSDLIVVGFDDEATAFELRAALVKLQKEYLLEMEDAVVVTKSADGKVALHQAVNLTAAGAAGGGMWGALIGLLFLNPTAGGCCRGRCRGAVRQADRYRDQRRFPQGSGQCADARRGGGGCAGTQGDR